MAYRNRLLAGVMLCVGLASSCATGESQIADAASTQQGQANPAETLDPVNDQEQSLPRERCQRAESPSGDFITEVTPEELVALSEELRSVMGPSFTGLSWQSSTRVEVYGTAPDAPIDLTDVGGRHEIEVVYRQVPATSTDLDETMDWLGHDIRLADVDVRTAYADVTCGAVVVIVGDDASQMALEERAAEADRLTFLAFVVDPAYVVTLRELGGLPTEATGHSSSCPLIRGIGLDASEYLGVEENQAQPQASEAGLTVIVECRDGEVIPPPRPTNIDNSRLWISIDGGVITSAYRV